MVSFLRQLCAVFVYKNHGVVDISRLIGCSIGCIACAIHNILIPTGKSVGISVVRCLGGICRNDHLIAIMVGFLRQLCAVFVYKNHGVVDISGLIGCSIGCIAFAIYNSLVPAGKSVGISVVRCLGRLIRNRDYFSQMIFSSGDLGIVVVYKGHGIVLTIRLINSR